MHLPWRFLYELFVVCALTTTTRVVASATPTTAFLMLLLVGTAYAFSCQLDSVPTPKDPCLSLRFIPL